MAKKDWLQLMFYISIVALPVLQFCIMYIGVNFNSILLAFKSYDHETGAYTWVGLDNFKTFLLDMSVGSFAENLIKNSLVLFLVQVCFGTGLSLLFSYYIYKKMPASKAFHVILFLPSVISMLVMSLMFKYFAGNALPTLMDELFHVKMEDPFASLDTQFICVLFFSVWSGFGSSVLIYSSSMSGISDSVIEAAQLDGITPLKEFIFICIPSIYPTLVTFLVVAVANLFTNQGAIFAFYSDMADPYIQTVGYYLFVKVVGTAAKISDYPYAASAGILLTILAVPLTLIARLLLERLGPKTE